MWVGGGWGEPEASYVGEGSRKHLMPSLWWSFCPLEKRGALQGLSVVSNQYLSEPP